MNESERKRQWHREQQAALREVRKRLEDQQPKNAQGHPVDCVCERCFAAALGEK